MNIMMITLGEWNDAETRATIEQFRTTGKALKP